MEGTADCLICCGSDNGNRESETEGKNTGSNKSPPWKLNLVIHENAESKGNYDGEHKHKVEPPVGYILILPHQPCVNIFPVLHCIAESIVYFPAKKKGFQQFRRFTATNQVIGKVSGDDYAPSIEESNMGESGSNVSKSQAIWQSKEHGNIHPSKLLVGRDVELEMFVNNGPRVVGVSIGREEIGREDREVLGIVSVEAPVKDGCNKIDNENVSNKDVDNGKEGHWQGAAQKSYHRVPIKSECANGKATSTGANLLGSDRLGEDVAKHRNTTDGGKEVARHHIPTKAADEGNHKKLPSTQTSTSVLLMQCPASSSSYKDVAHLYSSYTSKYQYISIVSTIALLLAWPCESSSFDCKFVV